MSVNSASLRKFPRGKFGVRDFKERAGPPLRTDYKDTKNLVINKGITKKNARGNGGAASGISPGGICPVSVALRGRALWAGG